MKDLGAAGNRNFVMDMHFFKSWLQNPYARLMRFDRPVGFFLLLWPVLWTLWIAADGQPDSQVLLVFVLGVVLLRSAGCVINDYVDRHLDAQVSRTRGRPLASGEIKPRQALALSGILLALAFLLVLTLSLPTQLMAVAALLFIIPYPYMKRLHHYPQAYLGASFAWGVLMAWVAQTNSFPTLPVWLIYFSTVAWALAYDTMYALADYADDKKAGIKSTAIAFGSWVRFAIAGLQVLTLVLLSTLGMVAQLGLFYELGLLAAAGLAVYQQYLLGRADNQAYLRAFANNAWFGLVVFAGLFADKLFL